MKLNTDDLRAVLQILKDYDGSADKSTAARLAENFDIFWSKLAPHSTNLSNEKRIELCLTAAANAAQIGASEAKSFFDAAAQFVIKDGELAENSRTGLWQRKQISANIAKTQAEIVGVNSQVMKNQVESMSVALSVDDNLLINRLNVRSNVFSATAVANNLDAITNQASQIYSDIAAIQSHNTWNAFSAKHNEIMINIAKIEPEEVKE